MREILREWGLAALGPDAEVIIAELAANAIAATRGGMERDGRQGFVRLWMLGDLSRLLILVWDPTPWPPVVAEPGDEDEHGRGLLLVEALAARWRWYHPARPYGGKVVWALLEAAGPSGGTGGPRPLEVVGR
jgi:anti-sigma regulatory factor (Ser/Thr protein kinase)